MTQKVTQHVGAAIELRCVAADLVVRREIPVAEDSAIGGSVELHVRLEESGKG